MSLKIFIVKQKKPLIWMIIGLFLLMMASFVASLIQSDGGRVQIETHSFAARDEQTVVYDLYLPNTANEISPAPLIVVVAGFQRSRETQGHLALEFARRGFVVMNIDPYSQGDSSSSQGVQGGAIATNEGYGAFDLIDEVYDHPERYPYVDINRIGVTGHSAGGNAAYQAAVYFGKRSVDNNGISKVHSVYVSGYVLSINSTISFSKSNMGMDYALYDEGAFRNQLNTSAPVGYNKADMRYALESHLFVNSALEKQSLPLIPDQDEIQIGRIYGSPNLRNMRQVFNTATIHAFQPYSKDATRNNIAFFEIAMDFRNDQITPENQVWVWKEVFTTILLIVSLSMILPMAVLLYEIPWFRRSRQTPLIQTAKRTWGSIANYVVVFLITATFAALTYLPSAKLTLSLFPEASASVNTWFFPQRMNNAVMVWAVLSGLFGFGVFVASQWISFLIKRRKQSDHPAFRGEIAKWGIPAGWNRFGKTVLIALIILFAYYLILMTIYGMFHVDYRFLFLMAARKLNGKVLLQTLMYFPFFLVFYLSNSIRVNAGQMRGKAPESIKLLLAGLTNIAGLAVILWIQYFVFLRTGTIAFTELPDGTTQWLYVNILFTLIPVMFLMPFFHRWFYRISGNTVLGPIVICIIFVIMALNNSVAYIPL